MATSAQALEFLASRCKAWGGELILVYEAEFERHAGRGPRRWQSAESPLAGFHESPSESYLGLHYSLKHVLALHDVNPGNVIHEMGHVFLAIAHPYEGVLETDWLGWEARLAQVAGCYRQWSIQNYTYTVDDNQTEWGCLTARQRSVLRIERIEYAKKIGIIDPDGNPIATR